MPILVAFSISAGFALLLNNTTSSFLLLKKAIFFVGEVAIKQSFYWRSPVYWPVLFMRHHRHRSP
jgi:hypothetical protein